MKFWRHVFAFALSLSIALNLTPPASACGRGSIEPVFVFKDSPDLPFDEFTRGKIGILQPTFGRKALFIAYRYLNEKPFTTDEQQALVEALHGAAPEDNGDEAIETWIATRKEFATEGEELPAIYTDRQSDGYDFFPNCTKNAFEVATETLKDRVTKYGAADFNVRLWLAGQDVVFENCAGGKKVPEVLGGGSPEWLRKDRDYQIGAAFFYSLNFDEARARFEKIAADNDSPWQQTADYLVARTLVRQASLEKSETRKHEIYELAERHLQKLLIKGGQFQNASQKLLSLVKYRLHPEERMRELGQILSYQSGDQNLRQDLTDYVWLLDKFEAQALKEEEKRKAALKGEKEKEVLYQNPNYDRWQAVQSGELINVSFAPKRGDGTPDYSSYVTVMVKAEESETDILRAIEEKLRRALNADEINEVKNSRKAALEHRDYLLAPNRKWGDHGATEYEGAYSDEKLTIELVPEALRADDLSDWIFTFQISDPQAYAHALTKWRDTDATAWLVTALVKAEKSSPNIGLLMRQAEKIGRESTAFPTVAYHLVRLKLALGKSAEARKLLDEIISSQFDALPISAQNQLLEQRAQLAESLAEFLKYARRKPVTFYNEGTYGRINDLLEIEKGLWDGDSSGQTKEEYERETEESFKQFLPWETRVTFDESTADVLNRHLPLAALAEAAHAPALPDYLQRRLTLAVWTRAALLGREDLAVKYAEDAIKAAPEMAEAFQALLNSKTGEERHVAELWIMLKFPSLTPFVKGGIPARDENEISPWTEGWWTDFDETEYNQKGEEVPKVIPKPAFVSAEQSDEAQKEVGAIKDLGPAETYLTNRVLQWADRAPLDPRLPEVLYIVTQVNLQTRYGSGDNELRGAAERLLRTRYPNSPWTAKLDEQQK